MPAFHFLKQQDWTVVLNFYYMPPEDSMLCSVSGNFIMRFALTWLQGLDHIHSQKLKLLLMDSQYHVLAILTVFGVSVDAHLNTDCPNLETR